MRRTLLLGLVLTAGCFAADTAQGDSFQDDDPPIGCQTGTAGCQGDDDAAGDDDDDDDADAASDEAPLSPVGGPCDDTTQCVDEAICGADFEDGEPGALECRAACIDLDDEDAWCTDDASCCVGSCSARGLCTDASADSTGGDTTGGTTGGGSGTTGSGDTTG